MIRWISTITLILLVAIFYVPTTWMMNSANEADHSENVDVSANYDPTIDVNLEKFFEPPKPYCKPGSPPADVPMAPITMEEPPLIIPMLPPPPPEPQKINIIDNVKDVSALIKDAVTTGTALITIYGWLSHFKKKKKRKVAHA